MLENLNNKNLLNILKPQIFNSKNTFTVPLEKNKINKYYALQNFYFDIIAISRIKLKCFGVMHL